jgi:hypothetical protein
VTDLSDETNGESEGAALQQVLHAPAKKAIREHMHVYDDERVKLAEAYRDSVHYTGHCCATCGVRDPVSIYSCKMFSLRGPPCVGRGYLRRRNGTDFGTCRARFGRLRSPSLTITCVQHTAAVAILMHRNYLW